MTRPRLGPHRGLRPAQGALLVLLVALPLLTVLALAVRLGPVPIDAADGALAGARDRGAGAAILTAADIAGSLPVWGAVTALTTLVVARSNRRLAAEFGLISILGEGAATILKIVVARPRPTGGPSLDLVVAAGFPSGHVTRAAVLVGAMLVLLPWCARHPRLTISLGVPFVVIMAVARVSGRAHHTTDVIGACLLAAALLAAWHLVRDPWGHGPRTWFGPNRKTRSPKGATGKEQAPGWNVPPGPEESSTATSA